MKAPVQKNDLFYLIKGLSGNEKSYYKKLSKRHAANNNSLHLRLFDLIDKEQLKDEKSALKQLGINNPAQYSSLKNYLTKDVLDTMVFMKRNDDVSVQLRFILIQLEQLLEKKLLQMARRLYKKAWELATCFEVYDVQIQLLQLQNRILEFKSYKEYKAEAGDISARIKETLYQQYIQQQVGFYFEQLQTLRKITMLRFTEEQTEEVLAIKNALLGLQINSQQNSWTSLMYNNAMALAEHMLLQFRDCDEYCARILDFWQRNPGFVNAYPSSFLNTGNTVFYNDFAMQQIDQVIRHLDCMQQLANEHIRNDYYRKQWQLINFNTTLKIYHKTARYDKVRELVDTQAAETLQFARMVATPAETLPLYNSVAISYFVLEQWDKAEEMLQEGKEINREVNREDVLYFALVFHLLILFEKKEWYRLDSAIESAYHLLYSRKKLRPFEKELMLFLKRLPTARSKHTTVELIEGFLKKLEQYKNDPVKNLYFLYFNYYGWLESKVMGIPYHEYMTRKINGVL